MSEYTNFVSMTKPEAADYLVEFLDDMEPALERFASSVEVLLTFEPASLREAWASTVTRLSWRVGYAPPSRGQPGPRIGTDEIEPAQELPSWFHHPSGAGYARFSSESLWLIDGAARYLGETVIRSTAGHWAPGNERMKGYMFQNQPVIVGVTADPVSPMQTCAVLASKELGSTTPAGPRTLTDVYERWVS
ncbi:hypothetical protein [Aeromicrobium sp. Leaf245]|uniref:hypothetical protein n=1 Tax=Aeromicrobium sp. Leaf245 TaxID=1736306 RepID=UPI0006F89ED2|nr:hypothetical protein [Aeromicrobium sp. Leaf245]KQO36515.1 hypothetical protein ASF05_10130 [Aeromicrobium sp. Leaf245]